MYEFMDFNKENINMVDVKKVKKIVVVIGIGNVMEWFDFGVYVYIIVYIGMNFFFLVENVDIW